MFKLTSKPLIIKEQHIFDLKPQVSDQRRKAIISRALAYSPKLQIINKQNPYYESYALIKQQKANALAKYENSILWSPRFTPKKFKTLFLLPAIGVFLLLTYMRYIHHPRIMMEKKKKYGIRFKTLEERNWLDGWEQKEDPILKFEAWTLQDLDKLEKEGLFEKEEASLSKKTKKFVTGNKQFVLSNFKKNT